MSESAVAETTQTNAAATQAQPVTESPVDDELTEGTALLEEIAGKRETQDQARTEATGSGTEDEAQPDEFESALEAARAAAAEEAAAKARDELTKEQEERNQREERRREVAGITQSFATRAQQLRAVLGEVLGGQDVSYDVNGQKITGADIVNWALNQFESHHGQSSIVTHTRYREGLLAYAKEELGDEDFAEIAKGEQDGKFPNYRALNKAVTDAIRGNAKKGLFTEAQVKDREARAALAVRRAFEADPERFLSRKSTAESRTSTGASTRPTTMSEVRLMHIGQHPSGRRLSTAEMRDYEARNMAGKFPD
ncbi:MAG: hypothetical protein AB7E70_20175 [Hyphomicrobiaceae bacterium]